MEFVAGPIEVVYRAIVDLNLRWRSGCLGLLGPLDAWRSLDRVILRANFEQKRDVGFPINGKTRTPCRIQGNSRSKIPILQIGLTSDAVLRNGKDHSPAAVRPADHANSFAYDEGLGLQVTERAIGVVRSLRPRSDAAFAICGDVARLETIGKQHDVSVRGQELRPSRLACNQRAFLEKTVAAMKRHDRRKRTNPFRFHQKPTQQGRFAARQRTIQGRKEHALPRQRGAGRKKQED